jgi:isopenicillin N synthase-like dioxygenase
MPEKLAPVSIATSPDDLAQPLGRAFERYGFAIVRDHGIDAELIDRAYAVSRAFFALPKTTKRRYHLPCTGGARGYTPFGVETAKDATLADLKEFWHVGRELPRGHPYAALMPPNLWPDEVPGLRETMLELFTAFERTGATLLSAIARYLGLAPDFFEDPVQDGNSVLRLLHYPPVGSAGGAVRSGAHEDINTITLLLGAEEGGLELLTREGEWLPVDPAPGELVVNIGDMLQRLTNHVLPSTTHRVVNPAGERRAHSRYSMPFFLHFRPDYLIRSLPRCISADRPNRYPQPITADAYLRERLREIRLA